MSTGHVVMALAGVLGAVLTLTVLRGADARRPVLVAAQDLVPGTIVDAGTFRTARIDATDDVLAALVTADDLAELHGHVVAARIPEGALATRDAIRPAGDGVAARAMSFPLPRARAVAGEIRSGDRVDVVVAGRDGTEAAYVATGVDVLAVDRETSGALAGTDELVVTLAVDADNALLIATALEAGTVSLVRATGAPAIEDATR